MKSTSTVSKVAGEGRLQLTRALRQLREEAREAGQYLRAPRTVTLRDGSYLELTNAPSADGGKLLGVYQIVRRWSDGKRTVYPV